MQKRIGPAFPAAIVLIGLTTGLWLNFAGLEMPPQVVPAAPEVPKTKPETLRQDSSPEPKFAPAPEPASPPRPFFLSHFEQPAIPDSRVRLDRAGLPPEELYTDNRLILSKVRIESDGASMQISGEVLLDLLVDGVPAGAQPGPMSGAEVLISLVHRDVVIARDLHDVPLLPSGGRDEMRRVVEGQSVKCIVNEQRGFLGFGRFSLPRLDKPLAPGVYELSAELAFLEQPDRIRRSLKWVRSLYGSRTREVLDPETMLYEVVYCDVFADPVLHQEVYEFLIDRVGSLRDSADIFLGDLLSTTTTGDEPNVAVFDHYCHVLRTIDDLMERQIEAQAELDHLRAVQPNDEKGKKLRDVRIRMNERVLDECPKIISQYGGVATMREQELLGVSTGARVSVLRQIAEFQDALAYDYWVLLDGYLTYSGWHNVNLRAYQAWEAIEKKDLKSSREEREGKMKGVLAAPGGLEAKWDARRKQWRYCPPELTEVAFEYLRNKEESNKFDADNYVVREDTDYRLNLAAWRDFRAQFIPEFTARCLERFSRLDTTRDYANPVWKEAFDHCQTAAAVPARLSFAWEYYIRTTHGGVPTEVVENDWEVEAATNLQLNLSKHYATSTLTPGILKKSFDQASQKAKSLTHIKDFTFRYAKATDAGQKLPGQR